MQTTTPFMDIVAQIKLEDFEEREKLAFYVRKKKKTKPEVEEDWIAWNSNELLKMILQ